MKRRQLFTSVAIGVIEVAAGCASKPAPQSESVPGVTSAQKTDATIVAAKLADATCKHAVNCNEIGGDRAYASLDACISDNRSKVEDDLGVANCPHGIDESRVEACLSQVVTESCSDLTSGLNRSMTCKTGATLCPW